MGHHINSLGQFQSDKYPDLKPDKLVLSFRDQYAREALRLYSSLTDDKELSEDIRKRLASFDADPTPALPETSPSEPYFYDQVDNTINIDAGIIGTDIISPKKAVEILNRHAKSVAERDLAAPHDCYKAECRHGKAKGGCECDNPHKPVLLVDCDKSCTPGMPG